MIKYAQILLISSDRELSDALIDQLELVDSFKIQRTCNLNGLKEFSNGDLIIYDDTGKGSEFLQAFSGIEYADKVPSIIILSNQLDSRFYNEHQKLDKFSIIEKPFKYASLESEILQNLHSALDVIYFDEIQFYPSKKIIITGEGNEVKLTEKETDILMYLYSFANQTVSKQQLLNEVWGYKEGVATHTLETHLYYLRKKLKNDKIILTEKDGYLISV